MMGMGMFALGWFLSVGYLVFMTYITNKIEKEESRESLQSLMIAFWIIIGVLSFLFR